MSKKSLLEIQNLSISLPDGGDRRHAIENLHLKIIENEILCVVGESGSGKSMMARSIMGLLPKRLKITEGKIKFEDRYLNHLKPKQLQEIRGLSIAMIFQEPMSALNPLHSIGKQIEEVLLLHTSINKKKDVSAFWKCLAQFISQILNKSYMLIHTKFREGRDKGP